MIKNIHFVHVHTVLHGRREYCFNKPCFPVQKSINDLKSLMNHNGNKFVFGPSAD